MVDIRKLKGLLVCIALLTSLILYFSDFHIGQSYGQEVGIVARYIDGPLPLTAPEAEIWDEVDPFEVTLGPQLTALPWIHPEPSIRSVNVKAVHNTSWISFHIVWRDSSKDVVMYTDTFRDAVAIMLPLEPGAGQCMGTPSAEVLIAHWKADWQRDVEEAFIDVADLYPNFWSDWYVMAVGEPPYDLPSVYNVTGSRAFLGGWAVGNPLSSPQKLTSVETLVAEGFGTLSTYSFQSFIGWGVYRDGEWSVVMSRPMTTGQVDPRWSSDEPLEISFAVWDGSKGEIGAKKGVSTPLLLTLKRPVSKVQVTVQPIEAVEKPQAPEVLVVIGQHATIVGAWALIVLMMLVVGWFYDHSQKKKMMEHNS